MKKILTLSVFTTTAFLTHAQTGSMRIFSSPTRDYHSTIIQDAVGHSYMAVSSEKTSRLIKLDHDGKTIWEKEDSFWSVSDLEIRNNSLYATGAYRTGWDTGNGTAISKGLSDIFLAKYELDGQKEWIITAGGTGSESGRLIETDKDGNVFVSGEYNNTINIGNTTLNHLGEGDIYLAKFNNAGIKIWAKRIGNSLIDELKSICWIEKKNMLLFNAYIQTSINLGNNLITKDNTHINAFYDSNGNAQKLAAGHDYMDFLAVDTATESIYLHTGVNYYDTAGFIFKFNYDLQQQLSVKVRKGTKNMLFRNNRVYIFGGSPVIVKMFLENLGYIDCYDPTWGRIWETDLGIHARINKAGINNGVFRGLGTFTDTSKVYGHQLLAAPKDQDVFLLQFAENTLGTNFTRQSAKEITVYPNPSSSSIQLLNENISENTRISIFSADGKLMTCRQIISQPLLTFDVSDLAPGVYYITIHDSEHTSTIQFLIQQ